METKKEDPTMVPRDPIAAKKPWQTPRLTCETEANGAQKIAALSDNGITVLFGPS
jgi:hypothetical protein